MMKSSRSFLGVASKYSKRDFQVSVLSNGLKVITRDDGSGITGVGLFTSCAPSNESKGSYGSSAIFESVPLYGNKIHSSQHISKFLETTGNSFKCINVKECLGFMTMVPRYHTDDALSMLTGMALHPLDDADLFQRGKENLAITADLFDRDATRVVFEQVYTAGWGNAGVGVPQVPPVKTVEALTRENYLNFHKTYTRPETSVVAATGVADHDAFVQKVEKIVQFDCVPANQVPPAPAASYRGGSLLRENLEAPDSTRKFAEKNLTHIAMCMPTKSMKDPQYYAYCILQTLMGGGTSFSSGGPGKGLHTKLFQEVINREGWLHGIECLTGWFQCGGLVGLYGQCPHEWNAHLHRVMLYQLASMSQRVTEAQLQMAKNQLISQLVLLGESREMIVEEMGKNLLLHDHITTSDELLKGTETVTIDDLHKACKEAILGKRMAYSVFGNLERLPNHSETDAALQQIFKKLNKC